MTTGTQTTRYTELSTMDAPTSDDQLIKSQRVHGRFINAFNEEFKMPGFATILRWALGAPNNTNLPANLNELNTHLPIIKHQPHEITANVSGIRFIWIGHASCLVQMDNFVFITDPVFSERCGVTPHVGPKRFRPPALTVEDLPDNLEAVLISHNHYDHLDYPSVRSLNERYGNRLTWFCGLGGRDWFLKCHIQNVVELDWWQEWIHPKNKNIQVAFCPAQHWSRRTIFDENKSLWGGYAVKNEHQKFYFAGDTGYTHKIPIFRQIGKKFGPFDLSAIPIGAYEPRWMMEAQHVSPNESVQIHIDTGSKKSIAIHWGTWALANEFYLEPKEHLMKAIQERELDPELFICVKHGEIIDIPKNN